MVIQPNETSPILTLLPMFIVINLIFILSSLLLGQPEYFLQVALTVVIVFFIGMPHGALDVIMINRLGRQFTRQYQKLNKRLWVFILATVYVVIVIVSWYAWLLSPTVCLALFLGIATIHFRHDWRFAPNELSKFCIALITITLPSLSSPELLQQYFGALGASAERVMIVIRGMQVCVSVSMIYCILKFMSSIQRQSLFIWLAALTLSACLLPPLLYFCTYFCAVHSILHTLQIKEQNKLSWFNVAKVTLIPMAGTAVLLAIFFVALPDGELSDLLLQVTFIGLFALTVPHMLLTLVYDASLSTQRSCESK